MTVSSASGRWPIASLGSLSATLDYGLSESAIFEPVGPKYLRITDIQEDKVNWSDVPFCRSSAVNQKSYLRAGDIVFARTGATTGKSFLIRECPSEAVFASYLIRLRLASGVDPGFVAHYLTTPDYWRQISLSAVGAAQPGVNASKLRELKLPLPPLEEQRRIAAILDSADALREKRRQALALVEQLTQSVFLEMFGELERSSEVNLGDLLIASPNYGTMKPPQVDAGSWLCLRVKNIQDWNLVLDDSKFVDLEPSEIEKASLKEGDIVLARAIASQDHLGKSVIVSPGSAKWAFDSHLMRIRLNHNQILPKYLVTFLRTPEGRRRFLGVSRQTAVQFNVNGSQIKQLQIPLPPLELQQEFARRVEAIEKLKSAHQQSLKEMDALFASLQHRAFRGEL